MSSAISQENGVARRRRAGPMMSPEFRTTLVLLAPSLALLSFVIAYPVVRGFVYTFTNDSLLKAGRFVGIDNYIHLFEDHAFWHSLGFSALFAAANVVGCYLLGLGLAVVLQKDFPGRGVFRVMLLTPWIVPSLVAVTSWRWMVSDDGALVNKIIVALGGDPIYFLSSSAWTIAIVILVKIWVSFPFMMLSLLASLQAVDRTLYEAAEIDGATPWQAFCHVTCPEIKGVSIVLCVLMTIWTVNDFDTPWLFARGGPANATENLVVLAYRYTFARNDVGMGATVSFVTLFILMALFLVVMKISKGATNEK